MSVFAQGASYLNEAIASVTPLLNTSTEVFKKAFLAGAEVMFAGFSKTVAFS